MLAARSSRFATAQSGPVRRAVAVRAFKPVRTEDLVATLTAGSLLLATPAFASLPEGYASPQGSDTAAVEAKLDALIEQRTGKAEALPELTEVPAEAPVVEKAKAPVVVAAPMAPAVAEPPAPRVEAPPAPAPAPAPAVAPARVPAPVAAPVAKPLAKPAPPKGLQVRPEAGSAAAAAPAPAPSSALLIAGSVATLGVVAAVALASNKGSEDATAAPAAAAAPPADAPEGGVEAAAAVSGGGESTNPSSKAE